MADQAPVAGVDDVSGERHGERIGLEHDIGRIDQHDQAIGVSVTDQEIEETKEAARHAGHARLR